MEKTICMRPPKEGYLKCYYGYKNFWDEILAFGVINWIFREYPTIQKLYIEVGDKERFDHRLSINSHYVEVDLCKLETIQKNNYWGILRRWLCNPKALKFFGWWEVFTEARGRLHWWRNYLLLFRSDFLRKNVVLLWWFWTPKKKWLDILYKWTVNNCQKVVVRESRSMRIVSSYLHNKNVDLVKHDDFSTEVVKKRLNRQKQGANTVKKQNIVLWNLTPYRQLSSINDKSKLSVHVWWHCQHLFFPCGQEDVDTVWQLKVISDSIVAYYRRDNDIDTTLTLMSTVSTAVGSRLHFLFVSYLLGVEVKPIAYQEKILTFLEEYGWESFDEQK